MFSDYKEKAKTVSYAYPKVVLPKDKSTWTVGHEILARMEEFRSNTYIPTLVISIFQNQVLQLVHEEKSHSNILNPIIAASFFETTKFENPSYLDKMGRFKKFKSLIELRLLDFFQFNKNLLLPYMLRAKIIQIKHNLSNLRLFLKDLEQAEGDLTTARKNKALPSSLIFEKHLANCGEFSNIGCHLLKKMKTPHYRLHLTFDFRGQESDTDHSIIVFRTDNKELSFKEMMADFYHPSVRILDLWLGRCAHPKEMFDEYVQFFQDSRDGFFTRFKPSTAFLVTQDSTALKYVMGNVVSTGIKRVGHRPLLKFSPICVPHLYQKKLSISREKE